MNHSKLLQGNDRSNHVLYKLKMTKYVFLHIH